MSINVQDYRRGQVVKARNRLWRIEQTLNHQSEFIKDVQMPLHQVSSIDGVPNQCCLYPT